MGLSNSRTIQDHSRKRPGSTQYKVPPKGTCVFLCLESGQNQKPPNAAPPPMKGSWSQASGIQQPRDGILQQGTSPKANNYYKEKEVGQNLGEKTRDGVVCWEGGGKIKGVEKPKLERFLLSRMSAAINTIKCKTEIYSCKHAGTSSG